MKKSETELFGMLEGAFTAQRLAGYIYDLEAYLADETDDLERDNPELDDYIQDIVPFMVGEEYDDTQQAKWLSKLRNVIDHAETLVTEEG